MRPFIPDRVDFTFNSTKKPRMNDKTGLQLENAVGIVRLLWLLYKISHIKRVSFFDDLLIASKR